MSQMLVTRVARVARKVAADLRHTPAPQALQSEEEMAQEYELACGYDRPREERAAQAREALRGAPVLVRPRRSHA